MSMRATHIPYRRTLEFLQSGTFNMRSGVQVVSVGLTRCDGSAGLRDFVIRDLPRVQYQNSNKQFVLFKERYKIPNITLYFSKNEPKLFIDVEGQTADEIMKLLELASAEDSEKLKEEKEDPYPGRENPANFGVVGNCFCICEKPGQVCCSGAGNSRKGNSWWHSQTPKKTTRW